ncbi:hypothetical protein, partial [Stenotrophomonas sp. C3(2023)]|uniref:hypothetical protein n=1 Tax=Stenotrophomonas sp. C3(2023) TaxID=3080277 RepID=UPI00293EF5F7
MPAALRPARIEARCARPVVPGSARQLSGQIAMKPRFALAGQSPALRRQPSGQIAIQAALR